MAKVLNAEQLLPLLRALGDGGWHSGERLAATAGITRAGLAKRMQRLSDWGLAFESRAGLGYRLAAPLDLLDEDSIRAALKPDTALRRLQVLPVTDSTNARLLDSDPAYDPQALLAEMQTAGRGRRGRAWHSPFGANLYLSLAWTFPAWPSAITALPLAIGAALADSLHALGVTGVRVKWPNDLMVNRRKLGGILIEPRGESGGTCRVVVGVGINVTMREAPGVDQPWTTLQQALSGAPSRNALAARILDTVHNTTSHFQDQGFAPFRSLWERYDLLAGESVAVDGATPAQGIARGVDESGALLLDTGGQVQRLFAGDISLRRA